MTEEQQQQQQTDTPPADDTGTDTPPAEDAGGGPGSGPADAGAAPPEDAPPAEDLPGVEGTVETAPVATIVPQKVEKTTYADGTTVTTVSAEPPPEDAYEAGALAVLKAYRRDREAKQGVVDADAAIAEANAQAQALIAAANADRTAAVQEAADASADLRDKAKVQQGLLADLVGDPAAS